MYKIQLTVFDVEHFFGIGVPCNQSKGIFLNFLKIRLHYGVRRINQKHGMWPVILGYIFNDENKRKWFCTLCWGELGALQKSSQMPLYNLFCLFSNNLFVLGEVCCTMALISMDNTTNVFKTFQRYITITNLLGIINSFHP